MAVPQSRTSNGALGHIRVLDLTGPLGQLCGRVFADMGADVVKVEQPGGDPGRWVPPFAADTPGLDRSLVFMDRNRGKRSVTLDLQEPQHRETVRKLAAGVDVLVEDARPGALSEIGLGFDRLSEVNPGLVYVSITPFGQTGPRAGYLGGELIAQATGGIMFANGDDAQRPAMAPDDLISNIACLHATLGVLAALRQRRETGLGQQVDVSRQEVVLYCQGNYIPRYSLGRVTKREGRHGATGGVNLFACAEGGFISLAPFMAHHFRRLATEVIGDEVLADSRFEQNTVRNEDANRVFINERIERYAATVNRDDFVERGQKAGVPAVPVLTPEEAMAHPHHAERGFFREVTDDMGPRTVPGPPFRMGATPWTVERPVPSAGQHTEEVLAELSSPAWAREPQDGHVPVEGRRGALSGVRVADFTRAFAGPLSTMFLGFLGAQVVKLESGGLEDNRGGGQATFQELNRTKLSATIDTRTPQGKDLIKRLVARSDLVVENFRPNVMDRLELDYAALRSAKPDLIMVSMPGFGRSGPLKDYYAYGQQIIGTTGLLNLWGHPESPLDVRVKYAFPDYVAAIWSSVACMAALEHRNETGIGQYIELAQFEALAHLLGVTYMDSTSNGRPQASRGNHSWTHAPHDVYPCAGGDEWVAIAVETEGQWGSLAEAMGSPGWAADAKFSTLADRRANKAELDANIGKWTGSRDRREVETMLQRVGVPAGALATAEDLYHDPHLRLRGEIVDIDHGEEVSGLISHAGPNVHLSAGGPSRADVPAPLKGQHNDVVFRDVIGLSETEERELEEAGALR